MTSVPMYWFLSQIAVSLQTNAALTEALDGYFRCLLTTTTLYAALVGIGVSTGGADALLLFSDEDSANVPHFFLVIKEVHRMPHYIT